MKIHDFESHINKTILERGREYFLEDKIYSLHETQKNSWHAEVQGTDLYTVDVDLGNKYEIKEWECDCPYDGGMICKHVVAVFFAIEEQVVIDEPNEKVIKAPAKKASKKNTNSFDKLLDKIELNECQEFVKHYAKINKDFKSVFELYFSEKDENFDIEKNYTKVVKQQIKSYTKRGFVDYYASNKLGKELNQYIKQINEYFAKNNFRDALSLTKVLIREVVPVFDYCDDSNGYISGCVFDAIDMIAQLSNAATSIEFKEKIADFLANELKEEVYFIYGDFGYTMTILYGDLSIKTYKTNAFIQFIDAKLNVNKKYDYEKKFFIKHKILFLKQIDKVDEAEKLIQENVEISEIRTLQVKKLIEEKDFESAKKSIADGIAIAEKKNRSGTVNQWEKELLNIAVLESDTLSIRFYSRKFAFGRELNESYYNQWKKTFTEKEWEVTLNELIKNVENKITENFKKNNFLRAEYVSQAFLTNLGPIYVQENNIDKLWELFKKQTELYMVLTYYRYFEKNYFNEMVDVIAVVLEKECDAADARSKYNNLARNMKAIIKDLPAAKDKILDVAVKLKQKYPRRPAMQEVFSKLLTSKF